MKNVVTLAGLALVLLAGWQGWIALLEYNAAVTAGLMPSDPTEAGPGVLRFGGALVMLLLGLPMMIGGLAMEGRKRCIACRASIPARATKCRYCGTAQHG